MTGPETVDYALLTDGPEPESPDGVPAVENIVGGWPVLPDGSYGRFEPNPFFRPGTPDGPLDPFEAAARLWLAGDDSVDVAGLVDLLNETVLDVAADEEGMPLLGTLQDGTCCITVATAPLHRNGSELSHWETATLDDIAPIMPPDAGIVVNPGTSAPVLLRLLGESNGKSLDDSS